MRLKPLFRLLQLLCAATLLLGGCALQAVRPGMSANEVTALYGRPSRVVALASGSRLQYSRQPAGQSAVMVDLDGAGRVLSVREVLNPAGFARLAIDRSTREDTERELGRPASVDRVASWPGDILNYRWLDGSLDMYFWVYLDAGNVVRRTGQGMEIKPRGRDD